MPQLPFQRDQRRAARPQSPIGQLAPGRHIGITAGVPHGRKGHIASIGIDSPRHMATGGFADFMGDQPDPTPAPFDPSSMDMMTPTASLGNLSMPQTSGNGPLLGSQDTDQNMGSGFEGWLNNKHAGIKGSNWLQGGLTALTGILAGFANKKASSGHYAGGGNVKMQSPMEPQVYMASGGNVKMSSPNEPTVYMAEGGGIKGWLGGMLGQSALSLPGAGFPKGLIQTVFPNAEGGDSQEDKPKANPNMGNVGVKMAEGGAVPDQQHQMIVANAIKAILGQSQNPQGDIQAFVQAFGQDALQALVQQVQSHGQQQGGIAAGGQGQPQEAAMAGGGYLKGSDGGQDDTVPANNGKVMLSNGEYILDAPTVALIGGGNSENGARLLDQARESLRHKATGSTKQPKAIHPSRNPILNSMS